jgi:hypothetical protein
MRPSDKAKFLEVLGGVHDFYGKELSSFAGKVWWQACERFEVEQVTKALSAHLMDAEHGRFMPKPADIVRQLQGTNTDRSLLAWGKVMDAAQRVGAYTSVGFDDGLVHAAIEDIGGWVALCRCEMDELPFLQRRFCDSYKAYAGRTDVTFPAYLRGEYELINATSGQPVAPPVLIGNPAVAADVLRLGVSAPKTQITHASDSLMRSVGRIGGADAKPTRAA